MAGGFSINAMLNASKWLRGVDDMKSSLTDLEGSLDDAADEVQKLDREGKQAFDKLERGAEEAADEANTLEKRLRDVRDTVDDVGDKSKKSFEKAEDGVKEFGDEANSTAKESAASFDGSAESIVDAFQEIAANAFAGFGPAGAIAGLAAAAGIGLAMAGFEDVQEKQEESQARAAEWADAFIEAGSRVLSFDQKAAKVRDIITDPDRYKVATENAKLWGVSIDTAVAALAGSEGAIDEVSAALEKKKKASEEDAQAAMEMAEANGSALLALTPAEIEYNKARDALNLLTGEMERGAQGADVMSRYLIDTARATAGATEAVDEFGDTIITLPDGHQVYIDAETGQATSDVDAISRKIYGVPDGNATVNVDTSTASSGLNNWISQNNGKTIKIYGKYVSPAGSNVP
ncbi:hypothetical protein [Microbacterium sp. NPDC091662]|uniref:hypothetical protein n=1 Tax=Microbacterium sp. NPDC091662 TaxID=3364211 RepID=UPI0037F1137C